MGKKMTWILGIACMAIAAVVLMPNPGPDFKQAYEQTLARAKAERKPVLLDFSTSWCPPCKLFRRVREEDAQVAKALENVILLEIDCESGTGPELARAYEVDRYPTFVLLTPDGDVQSLWLGFFKNGFLKELEDGLADMR